MKTKIEVEIELVPPILAKVSDMMSRLDFGIDGLFTEKILSFETTTQVTPEYIEALKKTLTEGFEKDGFQIHKIIVKVLN